jgi:hypothetical protein
VATAVLCTVLAWLLILKDITWFLMLLWAAAFVLVWLLPERAAMAYLRGYRSRYSLELPLPGELDYPSGVGGFVSAVRVQKRTREALGEVQPDAALETLRQKARRRDIWRMVVMFLPFCGLAPLAFVRAILQNVANCH